MRSFQLRQAAIELDRVPFVAVDLALIATHHAGSLGAWIWVIARLVYLPAYVLGWVYIRTALWAIGLIGLLMMLVQLALL